MELKLTDEEIEQAFSVEPEPGADMLWFDRHVADAATVKAAWGIVEWLLPHHWSELERALEELGIPKPEESSERS